MLVNVNSFYIFKSLKIKTCLTRIEIISKGAIISEDKVVLGIYADVTVKTGCQLCFQIIAILTLQKGKISNWIETLHETKAPY
jgi:hypothetical protein